MKISRRSIVGLAVMGAVLAAFLLQPGLTNSAGWAQDASRVHSNKW